MADAKDYLAGAAIGAIGGFFDNQRAENAEAKAQEQLERQAQLLMMKEERQKMWEMRKQKDQQSFDMRKQGADQSFQLEKQGRELTSKKEEAIEKRKLELSDKDDARAWDREKLDIQNKNAIGLKGMEESKKSTDKAAKARTDLRKEFEKAKADAKKDPFAEEGKGDLQFESWAESTYPELYAEAYPDGVATSKPSTGAGTGTPASGSKFGSIFSKVAGSSASRTKQGANDSVQEPAPISVSPSGAVTSDELPPMTGTTGPPADTLQSLPPSPAAAAATKKVEAAVTNNPASADVGQILGLFTKGLVNVGSMSIEGLKALKTALENTGDVSRAMTEPYKQLSAEVGQAIIDAGVEMVAPTPYEQKISGLNQSKVRYGGGNL